MKDDGYVPWDITRVDYTGLSPPGGIFGEIGMAQLPNVAQSRRIVPLSSKIRCVYFTEKRAGTFRGDALYL